MLIKLLITFGVLFFSFGAASLIVIGNRKLEPVVNKLVAASAIGLISTLILIIWVN